MSSTAPRDMLWLTAGQSRNRSSTTRATLTDRHEELGALEQVEHGVGDLRRGEEVAVEEHRRSDAVQLLVVDRSVVVTRVDQPVVQSGSSGGAAELAKHI